jgi:hypothetical protein
MDTHDPPRLEGRRRIIPLYSGQGDVEAGSTHRYGPGLDRTQSRSVANMCPVQYPALVAYTENRR